MSGAAFWKMESTGLAEERRGFHRQARQAGCRGPGDRRRRDGTRWKQLKRIYAKVQGFRNLSYEKDLTRAQRKEQKIKDNRSVADVLERGFGLRSDITRTFVALARAAGFTAGVVRVAARDNKLFRKDFLSFYDQLDSEAATVEVGEKTLIFDPATPFCPFGLVHWSRMNSTALRASDDPPAFFTTPIFPPDMALTQREVALALDLAGQPRRRPSRRPTRARRPWSAASTTSTTTTPPGRRRSSRRSPTSFRWAASANLTKVENFDSNDPGPHRPL